MDLSIIIPSFNTSALLERCLTSVFMSLKESKMSFEVIVEDNASTDSSVQIVKKKYPQVHLVRNSSNIGYGKANNHGIHIAKGAYILLLNSDIVVQYDAIEALYRFIKDKEKVFAGGKLLNEDGSAQSSCGPFFTLPRVFLMLFGRGDYWGATRYSPRHTRVVDWVSGACLIGKASSFSAVGLFDEHIFMYMEEIDLLYRAAKHGYRTYVVPQASFVHTGAGSSGSRRTPVVNIFRGLVYFYTKHRSLGEQWVVNMMLRVKALAAIILGRMIGKPMLVQTYEEALRVL
ncbi:glycosyltransferase family 2 protein [Candidatus Gottesmanbacteria bacterium]|nr:glycosyltransferase family 2 protein [Candidatus Gottesmanbacteria bacterium]